MATPSTPSTPLGALAIATAVPGEGFPCYRLGARVPERGAAYARRWWEALVGPEGARRPAFAASRVVG